MVDGVCLPGTLVRSRLHLVRCDRAARMSLNLWDSFGRIVGALEHDHVGLVVSWSHPECLIVAPGGLGWVQFEMIEPA